MKKPPVGWAADPWSEGGTARPMPQPVLLPPDFGLFQALRVPIWVPIWVPIGGLRLMPSRKRMESQVVASEVASQAPDNRTGTRSCAPRGNELRDAREVEANALVVRPEAGRALCEQAILNYVDPNVAEDYGLKLAEMRDELRVEVQRLLEAR